MGDSGSFFEDDGPFTGSNYSNNSSNSNNNNGNKTNEDGPSKASAKPIRFGAIELVIFIGLWIVMIIAFKAYTKSSTKKRRGWFGPNEEKEAYEQGIEDEEEEEALKKLLMRRCMTDVRRIIQLQQDHDSIMSLSRAGAISEEMLADYKTAEKELNLEMYEVQAEAETFKAGWGAEIIQDAARLCKIEDELLAVKKRKEAEDERKRETEQRSPVSETTSKVVELNEKEKQQLLEELLDGEGGGNTSNNKVKKRVSTAKVK